MKLARQACGDSGRSQQVIKTVHGRGYRMVAPVTERGGAAPPPTTRAVAGGGLVGREHEISRLIDAAAGAAGGEQRTVLVTGGAGAGKSTLVAELLERIDDIGSWVVLRGQCHRARSGPEPYFALLDALGSLAAVEPDLVRDTLDRVAPSWLLQLPALVDDETAAGLERRLLGGARQRMLREGAEAFGALAREAPTALVIEDLHLADDCTLDVIDLVAGRADPVPLLVIATARPGVAAVEELARGANAGAEEVALGPLDEEALAEMLSEHLGGATVDADLVRLVAERCDGNPLFALEIVASWRGDQLIAETEHGWAAVAATEQLLATVPSDLVPLIERALDGLAAEDATLLEAAAAVGVHFDAASVAAGLDQDVPGTETALARMARRPDHISAAGATRWPDGTVSTAYVFTHQLYRDVLHERLPAGRLADLHGRIGTALEHGHEGADDEIVSDLADHFVAAGDPGRAARYLRRAGIQAMARQAPARAVHVLTEAQQQVEQLPPGEDRDRLEMGVRLSSGQAKVAVAGWFDAEAQQHYEQALELAERLRAPDEEANARYALATISELHGDYERTERLLTPLITADDGGLEMEAHELVACSTFHQGAFERSEVNASAVLSEWPDDTPSELMANVAEHPATSCNSWLSLSNWFLGRSDDSLRRAENAVRIGERHRYALATALQQRTMLHQLRAEPEACLEWAERTLALGRDLVSRVRSIQADLFAGWAKATLEPRDEDLAAMSDALDRFRAAGVRLNAPYYLGIHADALLHHDRPADAITLLDEAEATIDETTRTYFHRSELRRLRAQAILRIGGPRSIEQARAELDESLRLAWDMGSPAQALRTTCDRFELERTEGDAEPVLTPLRELISRYDGQVPPPDVVRASALLTEF